MLKSLWSSARLDLVNAFIIAIVSITTVLLAWRSNAVGSSASEASRKALIESINKEAATTENWRQVYQEASFAQLYAAYAAEAEVLADSRDPTAQMQAAKIKQFLLPGLADLSPLVNDPAYQKRDGTFDLEQRFDNLQADTTDLQALDPEASIQRANQYFAEQRWLAVDVVLLAITLFWLTVAQISGARLRLATLAVGGAFYLFGLAWFVVVEIVYLILRRGAL